MPGDELTELRLAAELHDVGKIAIPDDDPAQARPADDEEWRFMHQHTLIGERILGGAPALARRRRDRALDPRALGR